MATEVTTSKRLIMVFNDHRYAVSKILPTASDAQLYDLAEKISVFHAVKPPKEVRVETVSQILP